MREYNLVSITVPVVAGVEVADMVTFYRRDSRNESHVALRGIVTEIDTDSFGENWLTITYHDSRFGALNYTVSESEYRAHAAAGNRIITHVSRVMEVAS